MVFLEKPKILFFPHRDYFIVFYKPEFPYTVQSIKSETSQTCYSRSAPECYFRACVNLTKQMLSLVEPASHTSVQPRMERARALGWSGSRFSFQTQDHSTVHQVRGLCQDRKYGWGLSLTSQCKLLRSDQAYVSKACFQACTTK